MFPRRGALALALRLALAASLPLSSFAVGCGGDSGSSDTDTPQAPATGAGGSGGATMMGGAGKGGSVIGTGGTAQGGGAGQTQAPPEKCKTSADCFGLECCDGACTDIKADILHCGKCGSKCKGAETSTALCVEGVCNSCAGKTANCNIKPQDGCEANLEIDTKNCGACNKSCALANVDGAVCEASACKIEMCTNGFFDCDKKPDNGCEVDSAGDPNNCGGCGKKCPAVPNAEPKCKLGQCKDFTCLDGFEDCDGDPKNGCETDLRTSLEHCGACKAACEQVQNGSAKCEDGACLIASCDKGFDDCDKSKGNGCETDLTSTLTHCGACGQECPAVGDGQPVCEQSKCNIGACNPGYEDCNKDDSDGCETNLSSSLSDCGVCGNACPQVPQGKAACELFQCVIASCNAGFEDCFGGAVDGCETDLQNSLENCGACGNGCPEVYKGTPLCKEGKCGVGSCTAPFGDCNNLVEDGCETNTENDVENCGGCGMPCSNPPNGFPTCENSQCIIAGCSPGFANCNGDQADGCEFDIKNDPKNCGGCGMICGPGQTCQDGQCSCKTSILVIADDSTDGSNQVKAAIEKISLTATVTDVPVWQYVGMPPASDFGAVVILAGGPAVDPNQNSFKSDMPIEGQTSIAEALKSGLGVVFTEWAAQHVASGRWTTLAEYVLLARQVSYTGQVTYTVDEAFKSHPLWEGLPASFKFSSATNVGTTILGNGNKRVAGSPEALDAVAIRERANEGRIVHLAHSGNYVAGGWSNQNMQTLIANAAGWAARCK